MTQTFRPQTHRRLRPAGRRHAGTLRPRPGPDQAQVGARLRDLRAVPQVVGVGRRRDQEAHQRQVRDPGVPGLDAGQGIGHQPGPDAGHGGHHPDRRELRGQQLQAAGDHLLPVHLPRRRAPAEVRQERRLPELAKGYDDKTGNHITALTYYGARQVTSNRPDRQARGHEGPEDPRARRAGLPGLPEVAGRQPDADRLRRGLPGAAERHRRRAGKPAAHDRGQEVLRSAEEHLADRPHRRLAAHGGVGPAVEQAERRARRRSSPT